MGGKSRKCGGVSEKLIAIIKAGQYRTQLAKTKKELREAAEAKSKTIAFDPCGWMGGDNENNC
jgi:predicted transcriptional regulator